MNTEKKILQDLTYFLIGLKEQQKKAIEYYESFKGINQTAAMMNKSKAAALEVAISGLENIIKKEEKRRERFLKKNPHRQGREPLTGAMLKKYSSTK